MSQTRLTWKSGADGARAEVGSLIRWRDVPRGRWQYGFYRGHDGSRFLQFSDSATGPITRWMVSIAGHESQLAMIEAVRESHDSAVTE